MNVDIHAVIGAFAVDALSESERARFEQHLSACRHCQWELVGLQAAAGMLAATVATEPPTTLRTGILARLGSLLPLPPVAHDSMGTPSRRSLWRRSAPANQGSSCDGRGLRQWLQRHS